MALAIRLRTDERHRPPVLVRLISRAHPPHDRESFAWIHRSAARQVSRDRREPHDRAATRPTSAPSPGPPRRGRGDPGSGPPGCRWWSRGRIGLLLLALIVLPWLPISRAAGRRDAGQAGPGGRGPRHPDLRVRPPMARRSRPSRPTGAWPCGTRRAARAPTPSWTTAASPWPWRSRPTAGRWPWEAPNPISSCTTSRPAGRGVPWGCRSGAGKGLAFSPDGRTLAASSYRRSRDPPLGPRRGAGAGPAAGPRVPRDQPGVRPRWPVPGLGGPWRRGDRPLGPRHGPAATAAGRAAGAGDLPGLLAGRPLARLGRRSRSSRPAVGPRGPAAGTGRSGPFRGEGPAGLLARRADAGHRRRRWGRAAVGSRDGHGAAPVGRAGRSAHRRGVLARRADRWPRPGTMPTSGSGTWRELLKSRAEP